VGYEGRDAEQFVRDLDAAGIEVVVDVRLNPISRKKGFSKRLLAEHLAAAGIEYEHLRALGNPQDNRAGFSGDDLELRQASARYAELLSAPEAVAALDRVTTLASTGKVALLCFEATDQRCHRRVVLSRVAELLASERFSAGDSRRRAR
jgi:uncharacterized protein (DUF488 family)